MTSSSSVVSLRRSDAIDDPLTAVLRSGARQLLAQAIEAEADAFLATMKGVQLPDGRDRIVRHGHGPERPVQTGIGPVAVQRVRLRDRGADRAAERLRFTSAIRERVRDRSASHGAHQGRAVVRHRPADGVQAGHGSCENMASAEGRKSVAQGRPGRHLHQRRRGHQHASTERRLITASPKFRHSSATSTSGRNTRHSTTKPGSWFALMKRTGSKPGLNGPTMRRGLGVC